MALSKNIVDREFAKFIDCNDATAVRTTICQESGESVFVNIPEVGNPINLYSEILSLASLATSNVILYTVPVSKKLKVKRIDFSGENRATFSVDVNGSIQSKKRLYFTRYNGEFILDLNLIAGDVIRLIVENNTNSVADFNGNLQGQLTDA